MITNRVRNNICRHSSRTDERGPNGRSLCCLYSSCIDQEHANEKEDLTASATGVAFVSPARTATMATARNLVKASCMSVR